MAHLDLDTTALAGASTRARSAGHVLASADALAGSDSSHVLAETGDAGLAAAWGDLTAAWASARADLAAELGALADGLVRAAEAFDGAERRTATLFVELLGPAPAAARS